MQGFEASGPGALADLPSTLRKVIATPTTSPLDLSTASTNPTPSPLSHLQIQANLQRVIASLTSRYDKYDTGRVVASGGDSGSTGKGILIGILSAFGSAAIAFIVLAVFFFFKYTRRGRIMLDRIGRPGEYDDEQAFAREEEAALESMDDLSRSEYLRAKGNGKELLGRVCSPLTCFDSICARLPSGVHANRYLLVAVPRHPRKRCFRLGIPA